MSNQMWPGGALRPWLLLLALPGLLSAGCDALWGGFLAYRSCDAQSACPQGQTCDLAEQRCKPTATDGGTEPPLGVAAGVYLEEYAPKNWVTDVIEINITNLAGVPSIVYGLLALGLFVYQFGFGQSILSAGLTLALLILPVVVVATRESIRAIPQMIREGSYACGATTWQTVRDHILPYSSAGILTGVIIGMARAIGETAPIITIGALTFIAFLPPAPFSGEPAAGPFDWAMAPFTVMPIQMFNWTSRPEAAFQLNAAAAGFVLVLMTLLMNGAAIWLRYRLRKNIKW